MVRRTTQGPRSPQRPFLCERRGPRVDRPLASGDSGFTLVELVIVMTLIALVAAMAMAGLARTRENAAEASAINSLRTIQSAQDAFRATCGHGLDYAASLVQLGAAEAISSDLATGPTVIKTRYAITFTGTSPGQAPDSCTKGDTTAHWYATAVPQPGSSAAMPAFATADGEDIWQDSSGEPPHQPFATTETITRVGIH
jgi:prepilin-type N-terminal cleavage/methylation domain-containing protein